VLRLRLAADPALAPAWRSLQLEWLRTVPGYREIVRERVSEAAKAANRRDRRQDSKLGLSDPPPLRGRAPGPSARDLEQRIARNLHELSELPLWPSLAGDGCG
jgi:hypothetical protein